MMLADLRARNRSQRYRLSATPGWARATAPDWLALVEAIARRDAAAADRAVRRHGEATRRAIMALAENEQAGPGSAGATG